MRLKTVLSAAIAASAFASAGPAATYNIGDATDDLSGSYTLAVRKVDFLSFSLSSPAGEFVSSLVLTVTSEVGSNFGEYIGLYSDGTLVAKTTNYGNEGGRGATISLDPAEGIADGNYVLAIGAWNTNLTENLSDVTSSANFANGTYSYQIDATLSAIPLPAAAGFLLAALGGFGVLKTRRKTT